MDLARVKWRILSRSAIPNREKPKEEELSYSLKARKPFKLMRFTMRCRNIYHIVICY